MILELVTVTTVVLLWQLTRLKNVTVPSSMWKQEELEQAPAKMSKSLKNAVNPDDVVEQYGADTLRVYEMFMGPPMLHQLGLKKVWKEAVNS